MAGVALGVLLASSIKYTDQWEKAVLLRLGRYRGLRGPGYFAIVPIIDRVAYIIDQRIRTAAFGAESCLTRDTVPVNVDAIAFWIVRDAERAALEVQDYDEAVILSAQTALRDAIGKHDLAELIQSRVELGHGLKVALEQKMANWGIQVQSVEIRDVIIPGRARGRHVPPGAGRTGAAGAHHPRHGGDRDRPQVRRGRERLPQPPGGHEPPRDEHALREHRQAGLADGGAVGAGRLAQRPVADGHDGREPGSFRAMERCGSAAPASGEAAGAA